MIRRTVTKGVWEGILEEQNRWKNNRRKVTWRKVGLNIFFLRRSKDVQIVGRLKDSRADKGKWLQGKLLRRREGNPKGSWEDQRLTIFILAWWLTVPSSFHPHPFILHIFPLPFHWQSLFQPKMAIGNFSDKLVSKLPEKLETHPPRWHSATDVEL